MGERSRGGGCLRLFVVGDVGADAALGTAGAAVGDGVDVDLGRVGADGAAGG